MYRFCFLLLGILSSFLNYAQLSSSWQGHWKGKLEIFNAQKVATSVPMELHIEPTDSVHRWKWVIIYGEGDKKDVRNYELILKDAEKGKYIIDEKNTIILDMNLHYRHFTSVFSVEGSWLAITYELKDEKTLRFEVISASEKQKYTSGGTSKDISLVTAYPVNGYQKAILHKVKSLD